MMMMMMMMMIMMMIMMIMIMPEASFLAYLQAEATMDRRITKRHQKN
jgi:hypothetical protein